MASSINRSSPKPVWARARGRVGRLLFRAMGMRFGDYRDLNAVDAWADDIATAAPQCGTAPTTEAPHKEKRSR